MDENKSKMQTESFFTFSRTQKLIEINILLPKIIVIYETRGMWSSVVHKSAGKIFCHSRWWDLSLASEISFQSLSNNWKHWARSKFTGYMKPCLDGKFVEENSIAKLSIKQFQSNQMLKREKQNPTASFIDTLATFLYSATSSTTFYDCW